MIKQLKILLAIFITIASISCFATNWKLTEALDRNMVIVTTTPTAQSEQYKSEISTLYKQGTRGFIINLTGLDFADEQYSNDQSAVYYQKILAKVFSPFIQIIEENPKNIILIFLDGLNFSSAKIENYLKKTGIMKKIYHHNNSPNWPTPLELNKAEKQLILFNCQKDEYQPKWLNYLWDFAFKTNTKGITIEGNSANDFCYTNYQESKPTTIGVKQQWLNSGRMPNFLVVNKSQIKQISSTISMLKEMDYVKGNLMSNNRRLGNVSWKNDTLKSNGKFEILFDQRDTLILEPLKNGFNFAPTHYQITRNKSNHFAKFEANGMDLADHQIVYFDFDNSFTSSSGQKITAYTFGQSLVTNDIRGKVALFSGNGFMQVDLSSYYGKTQNFSAACWFKIDQFNNDNSLLFEIRGERNILLNIQNRRLCFSTDHEIVTSNRELNYDWNHAAITADHTNQELTLFLNGNLVGIIDLEGKLVNPDKLFFGKNRGRTFSGQLDDLHIWNRTLNSNDVLNLYEQEYAEPSFTDELIAYYPMNKNGNDESPDGNLHGKLNKIDFLNDTIHGTVAQFNGVDSYIDCGNSSQFDITNTMTVAAWIKPTLLEDHIAIVGKGFGYSAKMWNNYMLFTTTFISDHRTQKPVLKLNKWQHVAYVFNAGGTVKFFYNGELAYETFASPLNSYSNSFMIGRNLWGQFFKGCMDEVYIWNRALSPTEIRKVFKKSKAGTPVFNQFVKQEQFPLFYWILLLFIVVGGVASVYTIRKKDKNKLVTLDQVAVEEKEKIVNSIAIFGGFAIHDKDGNEITTKFTPKLKQLFLAVLLHQYQNKKGITTKQLSEILWPDYTAQSAKNIRSTNVQNLRSLLANLEDVELVYESKYWNITIGPEAICDFSTFNQLMENYPAISNLPVTEQLIYLQEFVAVANRGPILPAIDLAWLDDFKGDITNNVIEVLSNFAEEHQLYLEPKLLVHIHSTILKFDVVNEQSMTAKVRILCKMGKSTVARTAFDKFTKEYNHFYGESYSKSFQQTLS